MRVELREHKIYKFQELPENVRDEIRSNWLNHDNWRSECVIDDAKEIASLMGIDIDEVYWSGFWSQSDGACFTGSYSYAKGAVKALKAEYGGDWVKEPLRIAAELQSIQKKYFYKLRSKITQRNNYYHEVTMNFEIWHDDGDMNRYDCRGAREDDEEALKDALRDFARWIYSHLEKEYEYQRSEEAVMESCEANGYEFDEKGNIQ